MRKDLISALHMIRSIRQNGGVYAECGHVILGAEGWTLDWDAVAKDKRGCKLCLKRRPKDSEIDSEIRLVEKKE